MTRILVTGANGHVGANVVRSLLQRGHEVVPFVRRTSNLRSLEGLRLSYRYGDMLDVDSLRAAMAGCEVVIHTAAIYRFWIKNPDDLIQPTIASTRHLFEAAKTADIKRIVYTSTTFTVGASADPKVLRNADDWNEEQYLPYTRAKVQAEKLAWQLAAETEIPLIVLCPNGILGPYDYAITPTTTILRDLINGTGVTGKGGGSFVDVRDVADIHAQAVTGGETGQRYLIAGENKTMKEYGEIVYQLTGERVRHIEAGRRLTILLAGLMELGAKLAGSEPQLTKDRARELIDRYHYYDCSKTERAFNFKPRGSEEMIRDAVAWLLYLGEIKQPVAGRLSAQFHPDPQWQAVAA